MSLITYEDKVALNENSQIADVNKVTASDMNQIKNAINNLFPIGFIISVDNAEFNPNTSWGGTWERLKGRFIVGVDEDDTDLNESGKTGGEKEVTLNLEQIPPHNHGFEYGYGYNQSQTKTQYFVATNNKDISITYQDYIKNNGGGQPHNNMPPYYTAYRWIKTAM